MKRTYTEIKTGKKVKITKKIYDKENPSLVIQYRIEYENGSDNYVSPKEIK